MAARLPQTVSCAPIQRFVASSSLVCVAVYRPWLPFIHTFVLYLWFLSDDEEEQLEEEEDADLVVPMEVEEDEVPNQNETVCAICDDGGSIVLACDGVCMRVFHR